MIKKRRRYIQAIITALVIINCIIYYSYIKDIIDFRGLSIADLNPYGGWSALKLYFTDLSYRWTGISRSMALTIGIVVIALLFGRFFCGFICPVGALQDLFKFIGTRLGIKEKRLSKNKGFNGEIIKYLVLILVLVLSILELGNLISPYSPWLVYLNVFLGFNIQIGLIVLLAIILASLFIRRVFCRFFCPLGALQALLYAVGPLKIKSQEGCSTCSYCLKNCPVNIRHPKEGEISPECINCLECVETECTRDNKGYSLRFGKTKLKTKQYIAVNLLLLFSIYILLTPITSKQQLPLVESIGGLNEGSFVGMGIGFGGPIEVEVVIEGGKIVEINYVSHKETKGYFEEAFKDISRQIRETQSFNTDTISGATATSKGVINAIKSGLSQGFVEQGE